MRSNNPTLKNNTFDIAASEDESVMTLDGVVFKTMSLLAIVIFFGGVVWSHVMAGFEVMAPDVIATTGYMDRLTGVPSIAYAYLFGGSIGGLAMVFVCCSNKCMTYIFAPIYAALEGVSLGAFSSIAEYTHPGIIAQAVGLTFAVFVSMLIIYMTRIIKPTENFALGLLSAMIGILVFYVGCIAYSIFTGQPSIMMSTSPLSIGISLFVVGIAAMNLVLDFDFIENGIASRCPKYMEWYAAFGMIVTLVWLYVEIVNLLRKLKSE